MLSNRIKVVIGILYLFCLGLGAYIGILLANRKSSGGGKAPAAPHLIRNLAINCGSVGNSTALDGREWVGESALEFLSGESRSSITVQTLSGGVSDPVPYKTSRISATDFRYTFPVNAGQKIVRLHFYPSSYHGFEKWIDYFTVKAGSFTLLRDFSASISAHNLGVKYIVKEFCLNIEEENKLSILFAPSLIGKSKKKTYAFVNGIEIISMPTGLYYTSELELGAPVVGVSNGFYTIDNSTALEVMQRLNIGGNSINPMEDFEMFRQWNEDTSFLLEPRGRRVSHMALKFNHKNIPAFVAPPKIYWTSWKTDIGVSLSQTNHNFTWKVEVDLGFGYLVRLHFCELDYKVREREAREFSVVINNEVAETKADVIRWGGDVGIPVYRDYVVIMEGDREDKKSDLLIGLQSSDELVFGFIKGLEIFKLSNLENNLAAPNLVFPEGLSASWNTKIENFYLTFGQSNAIGTIMTVLIILLSIVTYNLSKIWEGNVHDGKCAESASVELSYRCFRLAEIRLATQNFNEVFVIGKGGFGKVYRGLIPGFPDVVAIKRLNSYSRQGPREFWAEIETLSKLRHIQLVSLIGYCNEGMEMILVYEYIPGGTLADNLYKFERKGKDCPRLSWEQRLRICIGAARGLEYLHTSSEYGVIHRDVKDTNILLNENFVAKISDFGLSKLEKITQSKSYVSSKVKGTPGYLDPHYFTTHRLTRKSDVYSFGIVMLVVLSGKPAVNTGNPAEPESVLSWFRECMADGVVSRIVDPRLQEEISSKSLREFVKIVENCLRQLPKRRPTMAQVVSSLEQTLEQHQSHMRSSLEDAKVVGYRSEEGITQSFHLSPHEAKIPESIEMSPPVELNTGKQTQNLASTTRGENLRSSRGKTSSRIRKSLLGWTRKAIWNRDSASLRKEANKLPTNPQEVEHFKLSKAANLATAYTVDEIKAITENFRRDQVLGEGGFGSVYRGYLPGDVEKGLNPIPVAIKVLSSASSQGHKEWLTEVLFLGQLSHPNLVKLIGYCCEGQHRMLIYEFMARGSVEKSLFSGVLPLSWPTRMKIAFGAAKGLAFLHEGAEIPIIFRDLKTSNILSDLDYNVKLSDFGLAKDGPSADHTHVSTRIVGTFGYAAPEYLITGRLTTRSDVYSFGVVLVELLTGRRSVDRSRPQREAFLIEWAMPLLRDKAKLLSIIDPRLEGEYPVKDVLKVSVLAYNCLNHDPKARPLIRDIVASLQPLQENTVKPTY